MSKEALILGVALAVMAVSAAALTPASPAPSAVWPRPQSETPTGATLSIAQAGFTFTATGAGASSDVITAAFARYPNITFRLGANTQANEVDADAGVTELSVNVKTDNATLSLDTDESYTLVVAAPTSTLTANTVFGALRGLETFAQLVTPGAVGQGYTVAETTITDAPRFHWRGTMIDTARHWYPTSVIKEHIDVLAYSKFNVLHWHIVDDQSFPFESQTFPDLSVKGAYTPSHVYSRSDITEIIAYARLRGVRVVVEFDTPGHTQAWGKGQPDLLTPCYDATGKPSGSFGPINPIVNTTYDFLKKFFSEVVEVWPDAYVHLGGDEVSFDCWQSNPAIQAWMQAKGWTDFAQLENYYEDELLAIINGLDHGYIVWQEIFDNGLKVRPDTVINVWKGGWNDTIARVSQANLRSVLSSPWYLNYISYGEDWTKYYAVEPLDFPATPAQKALVMGGEVCMWSEFVDSTNFISRIWPRAASVGERLWSAENVTDVTDATARLHAFRCRLLTLGVNAEPPSGPSYCDIEFQPTYFPPWGSDSEEL